MAGLERWRAQLDSQRARVAGLAERVRAHGWGDMALEITRHLEAARDSDSGWGTHSERE
jgi:hypothetical protein